MSKRNMYLRIKESEQDMLREAHRKINNKLSLPASYLCLYAQFYT